MAYLSARLQGDFFYTVDVVGCFDYQELATLTGAQQEVIKLIVSAGMVDLSPGSTSRAKLEAFFPVGSATRTALDALLAIHDHPWTGEMT